MGKPINLLVLLFILFAMSSEIVAQKVITVRFKENLAISGKDSEGWYPVGNIKIK